MKNITKVKTGDPIKAEQFNSIVDAIKDLQRKQLLTQFQQALESLEDISPVANYLETLPVCKLASEIATHYQTQERNQ